MRKYISLMMLFLFVSSIISDVPSGYAQEDLYYHVKAQWHPVDDAIAISDGYKLSIYTADFTLIDRVELIESTAIVYGHQLQWSPDGGKIAVTLSASSLPTASGRVLQVWRWTSNNLQKAYGIPDIHAAQGVAWSPDGSQFAAVRLLTEPNIHVTIFDADFGQPVTEVGQQLVAYPDQLAWSPDGSQLAFDNQGLQIWDVDEQRYVGTAPARFDSTAELDYSPTENVVAVVNLDSYNDIEIWNTESFELVQTLQGHTDDVLEFIWGSGGIISIGLDGTTRVWNAATGQETLVLDTGIIEQPSWNPEGDAFVTVAESGDVVETRDATTGEVITSINLPPRPEATVVSATPTPFSDDTRTSCGAMWVAWHPNSRYFAFNCNEIVRIYSTDMGHLATLPAPPEFQGSFPSVSYLDWSPDGRFLAGSASRLDGDALRVHLVVWDLSSGTILHDFPERDAPITWSPDSRYIAAEGDYLFAPVFFYDIATGEEIGRCEECGTLELIWNPVNINQFVASNSSQSIFIDPFELTQEPEIVEGISISFNPEGTRILIYSHDNKRLEVRDVSSKQILSTLSDAIPGNSGGYYWRADGIYIDVSNGPDVRWDGISQQLETLPGDEKRDLSNISWSPDGSYFVSTDGYSVQLVHTETGTVLGTLNVETKK